MKQCARCKEWKDEEEFNWRWKDRGVRQSICRSCSVGDRKDWYDSHAESEKERTRALKLKAIEEAQRYVYEYLSNAICADCGEYDFSVLTFHHVKGKKMDISTMAAQGYSISSIQKEIDRTIILCFNCHMRRENEARSGGRFRRFWPKWPWES